jgi:hypothetical protein
MNPLNLLVGPPNGPGEPMPCAQVWSTLNLHQRETVQRALLLVCCQLTSSSQRTAASEAQPPPASSSTEVNHERA